jgi:hypothetical protein
MCHRVILCVGRMRLKLDGTRWRTGGEVKGKLVNGVGSQYSHTTSERGVSSITNADANTSAASSRLNWRPCRFKWTRPFRRERKSGFCACAITFQTHYTKVSREPATTIFNVEVLVLRLSWIWKKLVTLKRLCLSAKPSDLSQKTDFSRRPSFT